MGEKNVWANKQFSNILTKKTNEMNDGRISSQTVKATQNFCRQGNGWLRNGHTGCFISSQWSDHRWNAEFEAPPCHLQISNFIIWYAHEPLCCICPLYKRRRHHLTHNKPLTPNINNLPSSAGQLTSHVTCLFAGHGSVLEGKKWAAGRHSSCSSSRECYITTELEASCLMLRHRTGRGTARLSLIH